MVGLNKSQLRNRDEIILQHMSKGLARRQLNLENTASNGQISIYTTAENAAPLGGGSLMKAVKGKVRINTKKNITQIIPKRKRNAKVDIGENIPDSKKSNPPMSAKRYYDMKKGNMTQKNPSRQLDRITVRGTGLPAPAHTVLCLCLF